METTDQTKTIVRSLFDLLRSVREEGGELFSGIGVLVSDTSDTLPTFPLRPRSGAPCVGSTTGVLSSISRDSSDLHDGFHLLSSTLEIMSLSLYFSPPIIRSAVIPHPAQKLGGRYLAALFGSALPGVIAAGVASSHYGVVIFKDGMEIAADAR
jgi:hypothetical protein